MMKRFTKWFLFIFSLFVTTVCLACNTSEKIEYILDQDEFNSIVSFGDEVDLSGLAVKIVKGSETTSIPVTKEMVIRCDSTLSVGSKILTVSYESFTRDVSFTVKYKVEFVIGDNIETQYVLSADEIVEPTNTALSGYEFTGWSPEIPSVINGNMIFSATYTDVPLDVPNLGNYSAVYSDTLETITLPSNASGAWQFVDSLDTPVGNVGTNSFDVEFIPTNTSLKKISGIVKINVSKKKLEFKNIATSFVYDGQAHIPTYELDVEGLTVKYGGQTAIDVGNNYFYAFNIDDENYEGSAMGYFSITKRNIKIDFTEDVYTINFKDPLPDATYEVDGIDDPSILNIKVIYPRVTQAGEYEIKLEIGLNDTSNYSITLDTVKLVVLKVGSQDSDVEIDPETPAIYLNKLSTLTIMDTNPYGWWSWENPDYIFEATGTTTVTALFTPYDTASYESYSKEVTIEVLKREVTINIINAIFDYDGLDKTILYEIVGGPSDLKVEGNVVESTAGKYTTTLKVNDINYTGLQKSTLVINQVVDPAMDFSMIYDLYVEDTLSKVVLPEGYAWDNDKVQMVYTGEVQYYKAIYTPQDTTNYLVVEGQIGINVSKYDANITAKENYEFTYNGQAFELTGIVPSHFDSTVIFKYEKAGEIYASLINAGTYNVTITLPSTDKYNAATTTAVVIIKQSTDFTKPAGYEAIYGQTLGAIELPTTEYGVWSWKTGDNTLVGKAGDNYHIAVFKSVNENYADEELKVKVNVIKKQLTITIENNQFTYDGTTKNVVYTVSGFVNGDDLSNITVVGNDGAVRYGTYTVNLVVSSENYSGSLSTKLTINKAILDTDFTSVYTVKWSNDLTLADIKLPVGYSWEDSSIDLDNIEEKAYKAVFTPEDAYNYEIVKGEFVVNVIKADATIKAAELYEFTYDGSTVVLENIITNHTESTPKYADMVNAGTYDEVVITLPESTHYNATTIIVKVVIHKAIVEYNGTSYKAIYGDKLDSLVLPTSKYGSWAWKDSATTLVGNASVTAHQFTAIFTPNVEYEANYASNEVNIDVLVGKKTLTFANIENSFIYNTEKQFIIYDLLGLLDGDALPQVDGNIGLTNVGSATYTLTINDDNYTGSQIVELTIIKATPTTDFTKVFTVNWNTKLSDILLPNGYSWIKKETILSMVGPNQEFDAIYTPIDEHNYETVNGKFVVNVIKLEANIDAKLEQTFTYGDLIDLGAKASHLESVLEYKYFKAGEEVEKITDVGVYTVQISLQESEHYYEAVTKVIKVIVNAKEVSVIWNYASSYVYAVGGQIAPTATFIDVNKTPVTLNVAEVDGKEFKNHDTYNFVATTSDGNYILTNDILNEITIEKATFNMQNVSWNYAGRFIYNGSLRTVNLKGLPSGIKAIYSGNEAINVGDYKATVSFEYDEDNYNEVAVIEACDWSIIPSGVEVQWTIADTYTFNGSLLDIPVAHIKGTEIELAVTCDKEEFKEAGTYIFSAEDTSGNYTLSNEKLTVIVSPKNVNVVWEVPTYIYTGSKLVEPKAYILDIENNRVDLALSHDKSEFKDADTYLFTASLNDNNYLVLNNTYSVEVLQAEFEMDDVSWNYTTPIIYNGSEVVLQLNNLPKGLTPNYEGEKATNAGNYTASVTFTYDTKNYKEVTFAACDWEIVPLTVSVVWDIEASYMYNGKLFDLPKATFSNVSGKVVALSVVEKDAKAFMDAGDYTFNASIINELDKNNYKLDETKVVTVNIAKNNLLKLESLNATYGDTLSMVTLPTSEYGSWNYVDQLTTIVGNAGSNKFAVKFTPTNTNYDVIETQVVINVAKKLLVINVDNNTFTYDGRAKELEVSVLGLVADDVVTVLGNVSKINASTTSTTLYIDEANYYANAVNSLLIINKAEASIKDNLTAKSSDYNNTVIDLSSFFEVAEGESEINISITQDSNVVLLKNAGDYNVVVSMDASDNYNAVSHSFTYTINKISPSLKYDGNKIFTYNANAIILDVSSCNTDGTKVVLTYELYNSNTGLFEAVSEIKVSGLYKVYATIAESTNFTSDSIEFDINVEKGSINVEELDSITATYGQQLIEFEFGVVEGGHWEWVSKTAYVGNVGDSNIHKAIFIPNDPSIESKEQDVTFIVNPKTITFTLGTLVFDYNGTEREVLYTLSETPEGIEVLVDGTIKATDYVEGGYNFTLTISGNDNYSGSVSGVLVINQINATYVVPTFSATYNDTYADILFVKENEGTAGTWSVVGDSSTSVGSHGNNNITAKFTPVSNNYKEVTVSTVVNVAKADLIPTSIPSGLTAIYGDTLSKVDLSIFNENGTWSFVSSLSSLVGNAGENTFEVRFVHSNVNYNDYVTNIVINVAKADSIITNKLPNKLVYTGFELIEKYFTLNHSEESLHFVVTKDGEDVEVINAGTYKVVVSVDDSDNFNGTTTEEITVVVGKATPSTDFTLVYNAFYNDKLNSISLADGYTWANADTVLGVVKDGQQFPAIFTPEDIENYEIVNGTFTVNVKKIIGSISASNQTFDYDPTNTEGFTLMASSNNTDGKEVTYTVVGLDDNKIINAGTYTVVFSVEESEHYTAATKEITVTVNKKFEEVDASKEVSYGATLEDIKVKQSNYGTFVVTKEDPRLPQAILVEDFLGNANSVITLYVSFTPYEEHAQNFEAFVEEIEVSIVKKELTFTDIESVYTYDKSEKTVKYTLVGMVNNELTSDITVAGNVVITNVLESTTVTLVVIHDNYYGEVEVELTINKANPETDFTTIYQVDWNKTLADITLNPGYSFVTTNINASVGEIGNHTLAAKFTPEDTDNYNEVFASITYNVNKLAASIIVPNYDLTYAPNTSYVLEPYANHSEEAEITITYLYNNEEIVDYMSNAGEYKVIVTLEASDHYNGATKEVYITVKQATPATNFTTVYEIIWAEGLMLGDVELLAGYSWVNKNIALDDIEEKEYEAIFTPIDAVNYKAVSGKFMVRVVRTNSLITVDDNLVFTYLDTISLGASLNHSEKELSYTYLYALFGSEEFTEVDAITNAGTYKVTISVAQSDHYNEASKTITVTVNKLKVSLPDDTSYTATYGDTLATLDLPTSEYGQWTWVDGNDTLVGNASTTAHSFEVKFTPNDKYKQNYDTNTVNVNVTVGKLKIEFTNIVDEYSYSNTRCYVTYELSGVLTGDAIPEVTSTGVINSIDVITHEYTLTVVSLNYEGSYSGIFKVNPIDPEASEFDSVINIKWSKDLTLADVVLPSGYTWVDSSIKLENIEANSYQVKYSVNDPNYNDIYGNITVNVEKAIAKVEADDVYTLTYNGNPVVLNNIKPSHSESTPVYQEMINAGTYENVVITLPESTHYEEATVMVTVVIEKTTELWPANKAYDAIYGDTLGDLELPTSIYGSWSWAAGNDTLVGNASTTARTFEAIFTPSEDYEQNYDSNTVSVSVKVARALTEVTAKIPDDLIYGSVGDYTTWFELNHEEATLQPIIQYNGEVVTAIENAGSYTIIIEVLEESTENYSYFYEEYSFVVGQAQYTAEIAKPTNLKSTYGELLSTVKLPTDDDNGDWSWDEPTDTVGNATTIGNSHSAIFTPKNSNYASVTVTLKVTVAKRVVEFKDVVNSFDYNGKTQYITYTLSNVLSEDTVQVSGNDGLLNASTQTFTLTITGNDNYEGTLTTTLTINAIDPTVVWPTYEGTHYEDRVVANKDYTNTPSSNIGGTFTYGTPIYGSDTVTVTFTPSEAYANNYNEVYKDVPITIAPVAYIGKVNYGTIKKAVDDAVENDVIYVYVGTNPIINENIEIDSKVTLVIPHTDGTRSKKKAELKGSSYVKFATETAKNLVNTVTVSDNVLITNNGTIEIGGQLSGAKGNAKAAGQTGGLYAKMILGNGCKIDNNGSILCYGYINEKKAGTSEITANYGAEVWMPFILRDFYGPSVMYAIHTSSETPHMSPFNVFQFRNIDCKITIDYGANLMGWANLYADSTIHQTDVNFVKTSGAVINLTNPDYSYLEFDYDTAKDVQDIKIYGGADFGIMKLTVAALLPVSTENIFFPLSCRINISFNKHKDQTETASYKMLYMYKLLSGSVLRVEAGAELEVGTLIVYELYTDTTRIETSTLNSAKYPKNQPEAKLVVNGKLKADHLAGKVHTEVNNGAEIEVTGGTSVVSYEADLVTGDNYSASLASWQTFDFDLSLKLVDSQGVPSSEFSAQDKGTFIAKNKGWYRTNITISYDGNNGTIQGTAFDTYDNSSASGYTIDTSIITDPTRAHYTFDEWYLDASCTIPANGVTVYNNTTLYAKWIPDTYSIVVENIGSNSEVNPGDTVHTGPTEFNIETIQDLDANPTNGSYTFGGWYLDSDCTIPVNKIIGSELIAENYLENNQVILYALWLPAGAEIFNVEFDANGGSGTMNSEIYEIGAETTLATNAFSKTGYNFSGWAITADGDVVYENEQMISEITAENGSTLTLYAKWTPIKYYIVFDAGGGSGTMERMEIIYDDFTQTLPDVTFTNGDKSFNGWSYDGGTFADKAVIDKNLSSVDGAEITFTAQWKTNGCFASGTMIMMADGTMKMIDDIALGDKVLVMNHLTGQLEVSVIMMNVHESQYNDYYQTLILDFSNGKTLSIVYNHGLFDVTLQKYVALSIENYHEYIGHEFYYVDPDNRNIRTTVTLTDAKVETRYTKVYGPFTYEHLNLFAEGFLTVSGEIVHLCNAFDFNEDATYNIEKMQADIEKYGLYTHDDFKDYVTEQQFNGFNAKYYKVAVGKGMSTFEQIMGYINKYLLKQ